MRRFLLLGVRPRQTVAAATATDTLLPYTASVADVALYLTSASDALLSDLLSASDTASQSATASDTLLPQAASASDTQEG